MWGPKYFHERFEKNKHLYGFYRWARKVVPRLYLVEGQLDVVRMYQLGLPACAVLGSSISDQQVALLQDHARCDQISLAFDNDEVGRKAVEDTARKLIRTRFVRGLEVAVYPGHDPGDLRDKKSISNVSWFSRRI
jgi:DNA primase